jgi:hypothetical protein
VPVQFAVCSRPSLSDGHVDVCVAAVEAPEAGSGGWKPERRGGRPSSVFDCADVEIPRFASLIPNCVNCTVYSRHSTCNHNYFELTHNILISCIQQVESILSSQVVVVSTQLALISPGTEQLSIWTVWRIS